MNKTYINIIGAIAVIALLGVGILAYRGTGAAAPSTLAQTFGAVSNTNAPAANTVLANGTVLPNPSVLDYVVSRAFLYFDKALGYGNSSGTPILEQGARQVMATATTTPCALQSPYTTSTSTIQNISFQVTVGTSTVGNFVIGTSTTAFATSSSIGTGTIAANAQGTVAVTASSNNNVIAPGQFVVFGMTNSSINFGYTYTGSCKAIFTATQ